MEYCAKTYSSRDGTSETGGEKKWDETNTLKNDPLCIRLIKDHLSKTVKIAKVCLKPNYIRSIKAEMLVKQL